MIDFTKPVRTKGGFKVTILKTDVRDEQPVLGLIHKSKEDSVEQWNIDGEYHQKWMSPSTHNLDLENIPETETIISSTVEDPNNFSPKYIHEYQEDPKVQEWFNQDSLYAKKHAKNSRAYQQTLLASLKDPKEAMAYLEAALEESEKIDISFPHRYSPLIDAVKNVIEANKEPEQYVWIPVYEDSDGILCTDPFMDADKIIKRVGNMKIKLEKRFDE